MNGLNRVIIAGNLARDPDTRYTVNKRAYSRFTVVVNYRYKDTSGEYKDGADYISVVVWGNQAESCGKYLKKGSPVLIEGKLQTGSYEAKDGSGKRYTTDVLADKVIFLGSRQGVPGSQGSSPSFGADMPDSSSFGKSIGEEGFGAGSFTQDFANDNNSTPDSDVSGIPF